MSPDILTFTPSSMCPVPPPLCAVTPSTALSKSCCSINLLHFTILSMLLKYACGWNFSCQSFLPIVLRFVQGFHGGFLLAFSPLLLSPAVWHWPEMALQAGVSAGQTVVVSWHYSLAAGCCCDLRLYMHGFALFKAISIKTIQREGSKGSCASCITGPSQPAWTLQSQSNHALLKWSEEARYSLAPGAQSTKRETVSWYFISLPSSGRFLKLMVQREPAPASLRCGLPLSLILHTGGAVLLLLLSLICLSTPKLGASWLVGNVAEVQGQALIFVSKCCIQPSYLQWLLSFRCNILDRVSWMA